MPNPFVAKLKASGAFTDDHSQVIDAMCANARTVPRHSYIAREGEMPKQVYIFMEGWAAGYHRLPNGSRQISAFFLPGDLCDMGVGVFSRADHNVITLTPARVVSITRAELDQATRNRPIFARALLWASFADAAVMRMWLTNIGRRQAYARLAHQICELYVRLKRVGRVRSNEFDLPPTQEQLGDALGLTSVHVNRTLQSLRTDGLIALHSQRIKILDVKRLVEAAEFDPGYLHPSSPMITVERRAEPGELSLDEERS